MSTRQALLFSFMDRYAGLVVHTAAAMIIARLLTPGEIGVYSVVMVLLGFVAVFRDFGAGQYLVQRPELTTEVKRATFTVQFGLALLFCIGVAASAWWVARFYGDRRMVPIMHVLALNFLVTPFLAFPSAMLVREMRFRTIAVIRLSGSVAHASVAIGMALAGWGPLSMACANLATTLVGIAVTALLARLPLWQRPTTRRLREVLHFGGNLTLVSLLGSVRNGSPELLLGKLQSLAQAGLMSRAQGAVAMFTQLVLEAVSAVALPYFSREVRAGNDLQAPFVRASELVAGLGCAFAGVLILLAHPIVQVLYGSQWDDAVLPLQWLALAMALSLPGVFCHTLLLAVGAIAELMRATVVNTVLAVAAAAVGAVYGGVTLIAQLEVPVAVFATGYWLWLAKRRIGVGWRALAASACRSLAVAAATMLPPLAVVLVYGWRPRIEPLVTLACLPFAAALLLAVAARAVRHALWAEIESALPAIGRRLGWRA